LSSPCLQYFQCCVQTQVLSTLDQSFL
jgi:hypothetical protein